MWRKIFESNCEPWGEMAAGRRNTPGLSEGGVQGPFPTPGLEKWKKFGGQKSKPVNESSDF